MNPESPQSARSLACWFVPALAIYVAVITVWGMPLLYPEDGIDPSWVQALVDATDQRPHRRPGHGRDLEAALLESHQAAPGDRPNAEKAASWVSLTEFNKLVMKKEVLPDHKLGVV